MTLIKFQNPKMKSYFETDALFPDFAGSLDNFFKTNYHYGERVAPVNVIENDNEYQLSILVPGFKKEEIKVLEATDPKDMYLLDLTELKKKFK